MELNLKIEKILSKYPGLSPQDRQQAVNDIVVSVNKFIEDLDRDSAEGILDLSVRDLEEFLTSIRELKDKYEEQDSKNTNDIIKIDELKQLEFKLTELIIANRNHH